jgi:hypothetical protein
MLQIHQWPAEMPLDGMHAHARAAGIAEATRWMLAATKTDRRARILPDGWSIIVDTGEGTRLNDELKREVSHAHALHGLGLVALARRHDQDDVLFGFEHDDDSVYAVHLTWSPETGAEWPAFQRFRDMREFRENWLAE